MYGDGESVFYYLTVMNEQYEMPADARGRARRHPQGPCTGSRRRRDGEARRRGRSSIGSGAILNEVVKAQELLEKYGVAADVWSATSYNELYRDAHRTERWNLLHPTREAASAVRDRDASAETPGVVVAASDYLKSQPDMIARWVGRPW